MPSSPQIFSARRLDRGFTLIEVMVGVAIGMVGVLIVFRTLAVWDTHTRSTMSSNDALTSGAIAIFALERDLKNAGMGFGTADTQTMGCNVTANDTTNARVFNFPLLPVAITVNANGPDQIDVLYGDSSYFATTENVMGSTQFTKALRRRNGFHRGDLAVVAQGVAAGACQLVEITANTAVDGVTVGHLQGQYISEYGNVNTVSRYNTGNGTGGTFTTGRIFSLGPTPQFDSWSVDAANAVLVSRNRIDTDVPATVADGVVSMKAEYGIDGDNDGAISAGEWTATLPLPPVDWTKVLAVRVGVLVRSKQFEKTVDPEQPQATPRGVTCVAPSWAGGAFPMSNANGGPDTFSNNCQSGDPNDWRFYRYRTYQKVIPLRNMVWGTSSGSGGGGGGGGGP